MKIKELKQKLKDKAILIRKLKADRKGSTDGYVPWLDYERTVTRHLHIAYCLLRGRTYEEVECNPRTKPNSKEIAKYMEEYGDEDVYISA